VKPVREPDAGDLHVRFDERRRETEPRSRLRHRHKAKAVGNSYSLDLQPPRPPSTLPYLGTFPGQGARGREGQQIHLLSAILHAEGLWAKRPRRKHSCAFLVLDILIYAQYKR
jgi:hypothetical protein